MDDQTYGGDLPAEDLDANETEGTGNDVEADEAELQAIKQRMQENEQELEALRNMQAKLDKELEPEASGDAAGETVDREEADSRSIFIGNVDYDATYADLKEIFEACGTVNRVKIASDKAGNPKGFAYLEFVEPDAVQIALNLDGTELNGRALKVTPKRTNIPGMKQKGKGKGGKGKGGYGFGYGYMAPYMMMPYPMYYGGKGGK
mmetsp:Transcript_3222/g.3620  ORF Transcript_3222/g.3620 Transcript_3222/m.3620 type:complete len:205 (-) Transcript_3222:17-631(-)